MHKNPVRLARLGIEVAKDCLHHARSAETPRFVYSVINHRHIRWKLMANHTPIQNKPITNRPAPFIQGVTN